MKKVLSTILAITMLISLATMASAAPQNPFSDVPADAWYHDEVVEAVGTGIINGKSATEFKPNDLLTYGEALKLAACMHQVYVDGEVTLAPGNPWYKPYVDYCLAKKISTKAYNYTENVTRAGYIEIFANALPDSAFDEINSIPDGSILDVKDNSPYAIYVYKLYRSGIITGVDALHNCKPDDNIMRSEVAAIISRMMNKKKRIKFNMPTSGDSLSNDGNINDDGEISNKTEAKKNTTPKDEPNDNPVITDTPTNYGHESIEVNTKPDDDPVISDTPVNYEHESIEVDVGTSGIEVTGNQKYDAGEGGLIDSTKAPLEIEKQPKGSQEENYGSKYELYIKVTGGKAPYTYQWQYNGYRNQKTIIENGDFVKDAQTDALVLSVEKENTLLGQTISCKITDAEGTVVTSDSVKVFGPFLMPVDECLNDANGLILTGRIADGVIKSGDKVSVERNGKIIATGTAIDLQMFNKSLDEAVKGDSIGLVFKSEKGARPASGDIVIKHKDTHVIDTSDIVN